MEVLAYLDFIVKLCILNRDVKDNFTLLLIHFSLERASDITYGLQKGFYRQTPNQGECSLDHFKGEWIFSQSKS